MGYDFRVANDDRWFFLFIFLKFRYLRVYNDDDDDDDDYTIARLQRKNVRTLFCGFFFFTNIYIYMTTTVRLSVYLYVTNSFSPDFWKFTRHISAKNKYGSLIYETAGFNFAPRGT